MVRSRLLGIHIDSLTGEEFLNRLDEFVALGLPHQISYLNADGLNQCWSNRAYREAIHTSDLVYADGMGVVWASRLFGHPLPERVNANDLWPEFCRRAAEKGYRIFLLGGEPGVAEKAAKDFVRQYPALQIVGWQHGFFQGDEEEAVIEKIRQERVDVLLVGMGAPRQELWIRRHLKTLGGPAAWGVGGVFDYTAKQIRRAPVWMRQTGLEWFWRLCQEPRRLWKRYVLGNILFSFRVGFLLFTDVLLACLAWFLAYYLRAEIIPRFESLPEFLRVNLNPLHNYVYALPFIIVVWVTICASLDLYRRPVQRTAMDEFNALVKMVLLFLITSMAVAFLLKGLDLGRSVLLLSAGLAFVFMVTSRVVWNQMEASLFQEGIGRVRVLVVGIGEYSRRVIQKLNGNLEGKYEILGILTDKLPEGESFENLPVLGPQEQLAEWAKTLVADEVFFTHPGMGKRELLNLVVSCREKTAIRQFNLLTDMFSMIAEGAVFDGLEDLSFKVLGQGGLTPFEEACKRVMDVMASLVLGLFASPIFPFICLAIRMSSKGPAIFRHTRIGKDGKPFVMYKFRTMYHEVNEYEEAPFHKDDARIIPVGRWLRRSSLDELPQLFNVLKGEMSMVGPRPEMPFIVESYEPWQRARLSVRPGITGLLQISGRKDLPLHSNLEYDFYYIQNQSLLFDITIMLKTIPVVLFGKGAY